MCQESSRIYRHVVVTQLKVQVLRGRVARVTRGADQLPHAVILRHVVPKILFMISYWKDPTADEKTRAFMLYSYNVGLG